MPLDPPPSPAGLACQVHLSEVLAHGVPIAWHEAVAIVRVLALSAQEQAPPLLLPGAPAIVLDTAGHVIAERSEPVVGGAVPALRDLLKALLPAAATPSALTELLHETNIDAGGLREFADRLTFFARPDDKSEIAALVVRALECRETRRKDEALTLLTRKAQRAADPGSAEPTGEHVSIFRRFRLPALLALGMGVAVAAVALGSWHHWPVRSTPSFSRPALEVARRLHGELTLQVDAARRQLGFAWPETSVGRDRELPARRATGRRPSAPDGGPPLPVHSGFGLNGADDYGRSFPVLAAGGSMVPELTGSLDEATGKHAPTATYSVADDDVTPPVLVRQQMPAEPSEGGASGRAGELELLVGVDGRVEQARLMTAMPRYQDRMMVSAAKAWRFQPATRNGSRVRYRLRVTITW